MGKLQFGLWDSFGVNEMARSQVVADIYEQHIRQVQVAEQLGYTPISSSNIRTPMWAKSLHPACIWPPWLSTPASSESAL